MDPRIFKAYDVRGVVPDTLNEPIVRAIAVAFSECYQPRKVIIGRDCRLESPVLAKALIQGFTRSGVDVIDIGLCGTEEVYFHTFSRKDEGVDGGIMVTASHNPKGHNGLKIVEREARPVGSESGLSQIRERTQEIVLQGLPRAALTPGTCQYDVDKTRFVEALLNLIDVDSLAPLRIVTDPGHGAAGPIISALSERLPFHINLVRGAPDGHFPTGVPNPLLPDKRALTSADVIANKADVGVAWDGDFDRCFFYDEKGQFIEGVYIIGLLARALLESAPGATIIHDPRVIWDVQNQIASAGGTSVVSRVGHAFIKQVMREQGAIYGGEMSAHHYFRDFGYCDSGMLTWLHVMRLLSQSDQPFSALVADRIRAFPCSGEMNFSVAAPSQVLDKIESYYRGQALSVDRLDGLSLSFSNWRCNIRSSNTEPLLRLNIETRGDSALLNEKIDEMRAFMMKSFGVI